MIQQPVDIAHQLAVSGILVWVIQLLKKSRWFTWIRCDTDTVNRVASLIGALVATVGLQFAYSGSLHTGGQITIMYPNLAQMWEGVIHFIGQFVLNQALYHGIVKDSMASTVKAVLDYKIGVASQDVHDTRQPAL